jgi:hypothetical protein
MARIAKAAGGVIGGNQRSEKHRKSLVAQRKWRGRRHMRIWRRRDG